MNAADAEDVIAGMERLGRELAVALDLGEGDRYAVLRAMAPVLEQSLEGMDSPEVSAANFRRVGRLTFVSLPGLRTRIQELWSLLERAGVTVSDLANMPLTPASAVAFRSSEQSPASDAELLQVLRIASFVAWASQQPALSEAAFTAEGERRELPSEEVERVQGQLQFLVAAQQISEVRAPQAAPTADSTDGLERIRSVIVQLYPSITSRVARIFAAWGATGVDLAQAARLAPAMQGLKGSSPDAVDAEPSDAQVVSMASALAWAIVEEGRTGQWPDRSEFVVAARERGLPAPTADSLHAAGGRARQDE